MSRLLAFLCWAVLLTSCHDAPRDNPFDPVLTPAVELQVALDDTAGTATLTWTRYAGQQPFREYWVLRNQLESTRVDTLERISAADRTTYADTSLAPSTAYEYRVSVVNASGLEVESAKKGVEGYSVGRVHLYPVESDLQRGALVVRWNRYVGPDFHGYQLKRRVGETIAEGVAAEKQDIGDTVFVDEEVVAGQAYGYTLIVEAGTESLSSNSAEGRLVLPVVRITPAQWDSRTASATLEWTRYQGPRFRAYRVERRTAERASQMVAEIGDVAATSYVDTGLAGNTEYFYQVVVETTRDEEVKGEEVSGSFHHLVGTWPLEVAQGEYVRLYWEGDHLAALVAHKVWVRLLFFDSQGALLEEQVLLDYYFVTLEPHSVATYLSPEGRRYVSAAMRGSFGGTVAVLAFGADGQPLLREHPFFADSLSAISGPYLTVREGVSISSGASFFFDQVEVSAGGQVLFEEDFEGEPKDWDSIDKYSISGRKGIYRVVASKSDEAWQDFRLEAEVLFPDGSVGGSIGIGTSERVNSSVFTFYLQPANQQVQLAWSFTPAPGSSLSSQSRLFTEPFSFLPGFPYRMGLGLREGQFSASVSSPGVWSGAREGGAQWISLTGVGQLLLLMHGGQVRTLSPEGEETLWFPLAEQASETRSWKWGPEEWLGICLPARNQVLFNRISVSPSGNNVSRSSTPRVLGTGAGQGAGEMFFPLSFDASPDERVYVLDAGNARIQVFDLEGKYITQWGHRGSDEGEFDFGSGLGPEDFAGSVAVDDEGYIYVADVDNRRIQKFAP